MKFPRIEAILSWGLFGAIFHLDIVLVTLGIKTFSRKIKKTYKYLHTYFHCHQMENSESFLFPLVV